MQEISFLFVIFLIGFYFLPWIIAILRNHHNRQAIVVTNLLLGWTLIGWLACLIWSFTNRSSEKTIIENKLSSEDASIADELEKLLNLKNNGVISEEEFNNQKEKLLSK
jgi:hypothetical protein